MKRLAIVVLCLTCLIVLADRRGQIMSQKPPAVASGPVDPSGSNTLYAWWVASDLPVVTNHIQDSYPWTDRIQSILLRNGNPTASVSNSTDGIFFSGNSADFLTNAPLAPNQTSTACVILKPHQLTSGFERLVFSPYSMGDAAQSATPGGLGIKNSSTAFRWGAFCGSCVDVSAALAIDTIYDMTMVQSGTTLTFFTNGVQASQIVRTAPANGWPWRYLAHDGLSAIDPFNGWIKEVLVWSNDFSLNQLTNVHRYATNLYSYAP